MYGGEDTGDWGGRKTINFPSSRIGKFSGFIPFVVGRGEEVFILRKKGRKERGKIGETRENKFLRRM